MSSSRSARNPPRRAALLGVLLALGAVPACRCGEPSKPRLYDVGAPLNDLPRARPAPLSELVPGPVLLYAEVGDPHALLEAVRATQVVQALEKSGALQPLALSATAATLTALVQRLNDLSRLPVGAEALQDLLDGPLSLAVRPNARGDGFDLLVLKALTPQAQGALRLAQMLQAVHPSAQEVRVTWSPGQQVPVRALRVDGTHWLYYVVLRDRLLLATDPGWLRAAVDLGLGLARPQTVQPSISTVRAEAARAGAWAVVDGRVAAGSPALGATGRALAGLAWVALRWSAPERVELGLRRAQGTFGPPAPPLTLPPGTVFALAREASLTELLALPPSQPLPDGGAPSAGELAGRALLEGIQVGLGPVLEGHVAYALARAEPERGAGEHLLALSTRSPGGAVVDALAPELFRAPPQLHPEALPTARCVGMPAALCYADIGPYLAFASTPAALRVEAEPMRTPPLAMGPLSIYLDISEMTAELLRAGGKKRGPSPDLERLLAALRTARPLVAELRATPGTSECWGEFALAEPVRREPARDAGAPPRDGGGP